MNSHTTGTAGRNYRVADLPHPFEPPPTEPGWRLGCARCGRSRGEHGQAMTEGAGR